VVVVEPAAAPKTYEKDVVLVLGDTTVPAKTGGRTTYYTVNGKSAPAIPPIEVHNGERIRLRLVNVADVAFPLHLSGHKLDVVSTNGSSSIEPHVTRDTITLQPGDRYDVELTANNPGVWSLSSVLPSQTSNNGKFPGGIAVVVRYPDELR
jgi:FtsP/CotA-like multicopper oxidase with cupredoxin domain